MKPRKHLQAGSVDIEYQRHAALLFSITMKERLIRQDSCKRVDGKIRWDSSAF